MSTDMIDRAAKVMCDEIPTVKGRESLPFPCPHCLEAAEALAEAGLLATDAGAGDREADA